MALNPKFMIATNLQEYFVDKATGAPLTGGEVAYYKDLNRDELKAIYTLVGAPGSYSFVELPNPLELSSVGTTIDESGNDVRVYYYPYNDDDEIELYYITVEDADGNPQLTRQAWPNVVDENSGQLQEIKNFIPNGQFLLHTDIPATSDTVIGEITQAVTVLGQGGWTFERPADSTATDVITFIQDVSFQENPVNSPRYACRIVCEAAGSDDFKDLRIKFGDVNKFSSQSGDATTYTFIISAVSNGAPFDVDLVLINNYGTGGSTQSETPLSTVTIGVSEETITAKFTFGNTIGKTIGINNDDFIQIAIRFPNQAYSADFTDSALLQNSVNNPVFPVQTNEDMVVRSLSAPVPAYDASNLYLPLVLTPQGVGYDNSQIGKIYADSTGILSIGELYMDGSKFNPILYSTDGIPYARLQNKLLYQQDGVTLKNPSGIPLYGTGLDYFTAAMIHGAATNELVLHNNTAGAATATADVNTGFTISTIATGATTYLVNAAWGTAVDNTDIIILQNQAEGVVTATATGTSGYTVVTDRAGTAITKNISTIVPTVSTAGGVYWTFSTPSTNFYVWYKVSGAGADPAPGGTGILVNLITGDDSTTVAQKTANVLNGWQCTNIITAAASTLTAGDYFTATATGDGYYVWYTINGVGADPAPVGLIGIKVAVLSTDTAAQVAVKTCIAINAMFYAIPNTQGLLLRGTDPGSINDVIYRYSLVDYAFSATNNNRLGTMQFDYNQSHNHTVTLIPTDKLIDNTPLMPGGDVSKTNGLTPDGYAFSATSVLIASFSGNQQSQPPNQAVNWIIKY
jgi:hypothetical protein